MTVAVAGPRPEGLRKARGISFADPMILAILNTTIGPHPRPIDPGRPFKCQTRRVVNPQPEPGASRRDLLRWAGAAAANSRIGAPGDLLWVRETTANIQVGAFERTIYRATETIHAPVRWRAARFMFRRDSRITLKISSVRAEQVERISDGDAVLEGFTNREAFLDLFYNVNKRAPVGSNPWVRVYSFTVEEAPAR